ncbi:class I SAM-dependent methyltransferase [Flexivirga sp. B27]
MSDWTIGNDPSTVRRQYADGSRLATRASFWAPSPPGESPQDVAIAALRTGGSRKILEIGCGQGQFAQRMQRELNADVLATDQSPAMVVAAAARDVPAMIADAGHLPFDDDSFDGVVAMWMLYHVPDLAQTFSEVRRVLRPGGVFVAVTNGRRHLADLRAAVGLDEATTQFMVEDGEEKLSAYFDHVEVHRTSGRAVADHATARDYLASYAPSLADALPPYDGTRTYTGSSAVFVASSGSVHSA